MTISISFICRNNGRIDEKFSMAITSLKKNETLWLSWSTKTFKIKSELDKF